jgi:hypothetical protein
MGRRSGLGRLWLPDCAWRWGLSMGVVSALLLTACETQKPTAPHAGIESLWSQYQEIPLPRALAIAGDPDREWVGAAAGGPGASQIEAEKSALAECKRQRLARRLRAPCRFYATGNQVVW